MWPCDNDVDAIAATTCDHRHDVDVIATTTSVCSWSRGGHRRDDYFGEKTAKKQRGSKGLFARFDEKIMNFLIKNGEKTKG